MDEIDVKIIKMLQRDARATFKEMSSSLQISSNAVFKRYKSLKDSGQIGREMTFLHFNLINPVQVFILATYEGSLSKEIIDQMGDFEQIHQILFGSSNQLMLIAYTPSYFELLPFLEQFQSNFSFSDFEHHLVYETKQKPLTVNLNLTDIQIIKAIQYDARKSIVDIANEVGVSQKTVAKRLTKIIEDNVIQFYLELQFNQDNSIYVVFILSNDSPMDFSEEYQELNQSFQKHFFDFGLLPEGKKGMLALIVPNFQIMQQSFQNLTDANRYDNIIPYVFFTAYYYPTWMDTRILELEKAKIEALGFN